MANTPDTLPGTGTQVDNGGGVAWGLPERITAEDSTPASVQITVVSAWSDYLDGKAFGFSIGAGDTIDGIRLRVRKATTGPGAYFYRDQHVRLLKAGVIAGDDKSIDQDWNWGGTYIWRTYGGAADLWGTTWTPEDINHAAFGARVSCYRYNGTSAIQAWADCFRITVYYTEGPPPPPPGVVGSARSQERMILLGG